jgi:hypothetical protein
VDRFCPICDDRTAVVAEGEPLAVSCPRCGELAVTTAAEDNWRGREPSARRVANAAFWLREHPGVCIEARDVAALFTLPTPPLSARAASLMLALEVEAPALGRPVRVMDRRVIDAGRALGGPLDSRYAVDHFLPRWLAFSASSGEEEFWYLAADYLGRELDYLTWEGKADGQNGAYELTITPKGYAYLEQLRRTRAESEIGFCAMWFDPSVRDAWLHGIEPAIRDAGYRAVRLDDHPHNEPIDDEIIAMIRRSRFVVADATGASNGVYYEAGFAKGLDLPVIWTVREQDLKGVHFDARQFNFVTWSAADLASFARRLRHRIEATLGRGTHVPDHTARGA